MFVLFSPYLHAAQMLQDIPSLREEVRQYLVDEYGNGEVVEIDVAKLDSRLRLRRCDDNLTLETSSASADASNVTVQVACEAPASWSFYLSAKIKRQRQMVTAKQSFRKGHILSYEDLTVVTKMTNALPSGFASDPKQLIGKEIKRSVRAGDVLTHSVVAQPMLVRRGDQITIFAQMGSISVSTPGEALSNGRIGEAIRVKNLRSNRIVQGTVSKDGNILVL